MTIMAEENTGNNLNPQDPQTEDQVNEQTNEPKGDDALNEQLLTLQQSLQERDAIIQEFEAKQNVSPHANEFVENINKMFSEKVDPAKISQYAALHFEDFSTKEPVDLIRMKLKYEKPRWTKDMIDSYIEEQYGEVPSKAKYEEDENLDEYNQLLKRRDSRIKRDAIDAEDFLNQQKSSFEILSDEREQEAERSRAQLQQSWEPVIKTIKPSDNLFSIKMEDEKAIDGNYEFSWKPEFDEQTMTELQKTLLQNAVQQGLPINAESVKKLGEMADEIIEFYYYKDFKKAAIIDAINSTKKNILMGNSSKQNVQQGSLGRGGKNEPTKKGGYPFKAGLL
jgi:hypothetical protein